MGIKSKIDAFSEKHGASMGIIAKTGEEAKRLYALLSADYAVHLLSPDSTRFKNGITVTSVQMAKGLEFDEVLLPDVDGRNYRTEYDRRLLYIACTRAMHRLTLLWTGERSPLLADAGQQA